MKKIVNLLLSVACIITLLAVNTTSVAAASTTSVVNNNDGTVTLKYDNSANVRVKVLVAKETNYYYELNNGMNEVIIPLTEGNGTYTFKICVNKQGTTYKVVDTIKVTNSIANANSVFTKSSMIVNYTSDMEVVKKAAELTKGLKTNEEKLNAIYSYVVNNYSYDYNKINTISTSKTYVPSIKEVSVAKTGICYDISAVLAAMLRSVGIQTKVVTGNTPKATAYHAWNQVYNEKTKAWDTIDATYDVQMVAKSKSYSMVKNSSDYVDIKYVY